MKRKVAKRDFDVDLLPHNRWEVFLDAYKVSLGTMFKIGCILLLFALPFLIVNLLKDFITIGFYTQFEEGTITEEVLTQELNGIKLTMSILSIPIILIFMVGLSGIARVFRQMTWNKPLFFKNDFWDGVKLNYKEYALTGLIFGLLYVLTTFSGIASSADMPLFGPILIGILLFVMLPICLYNLSQSLVYTNKFKNVVKTSSLLFIKTAPVSLLFCGVISSMLFLEFIGNIEVKFGVTVGIIIIILPVIIFSWILYSFKIFDKYINKDNYPELYRRGLYGEDTKKDTTPEPIVNEQSIEESEQ